MSVIKDLNWRYATKKFNNKVLTEEKLTVLKEAFNLTATSYGLQTIRLIVVENPEVKKQLRNVAYNQQQVEQASHVLVIAVQDIVDASDVDALFENIVKTRNVDPAVLEDFKGQMKNTIVNMSKEQIFNWCKNQAYIALGNLLTVCAIEKVDSCPMEGFIPEECDKVLELEKHKLKSVLMLPVGYRAEDDMFSEMKKVRKSLSESVIEI